ncbi:MAG: class I SAM-dependent methyltransferase [Chloroflexota bacterium]
MSSAGISTSQARFDDWVAQALAQDFSGWDFSYLKDRWLDGQPSWGYHRLVFDRSRAVKTLLDMGTGGGEFLATLAPLPPQTWATEGYPPNVPVAQQRLAPLGAHVVPVSGEEAQLPFADRAFDLVINRHESFDAAEVKRILRPGARFVTQQVGGQYGTGLNEWLQGRVEYVYADWSLRRAVGQLEDAGLRILHKGEEFTPLHFFDIGAVVFYLKVVSWQVQDFSVERYGERLLALHDHIEQNGAFKITGHYFWIEAEK